MRSHIHFLRRGAIIRLSGVAPHLTLLDYLRLHEGATGTKEGCAEGDCGACTAVLRRRVGDSLVYSSVNACIVLAGQADGADLITVEDLARNGSLHPVQQALVDFHGSQCGFCTPGFVMSLYALWMRSPEPGNAEIEKALQGNLCRCTGYEAIVRAAQAVSNYGKAAKDPLNAERKAIAAKLAALRDGTRIEIGEDRRRLIVPASVDDLADVV